MWLIILIFLFTFPSISFAKQKVSPAGLLYAKAEKSYKGLKKSKSLVKRRDKWEGVIKKFELVYNKFPKSREADESLYRIPQLYFELYHISKLKKDYDLSVDALRKYIKKIPEGKYSATAHYKIGVIDFDDEKFTDAKKHFEKFVSSSSNAKEVKDAKLKLKVIEVRLSEKKGEKEAVKEKEEKIAPLAPEKGYAYVSSIKHWTTPTYTRIVISLSGDVKYSGHLLKEDLQFQKPRRLYIDLYGSKISKKLIEEPIDINDGLLKRARAGQYTLDTVRVVLDIENIKNYKIFNLEDPFRIIIDVFGEAIEAKTEDKPVKEEKKAEKPVKEKQKESSISLAKQLGLSVKTIVIDPGHGGKDPGALEPKSIQEKDIVLKISKLLEKKIKERTDINVILTRKKDIFIPLEERTAIANAKKADLFVSIHVNASRNKNATGIETYYLSLASDKDAIETAARENAISTKKISDLQAILNDLMLNSKIDESSRLAGSVQKHLVDHLSNSGKSCKNLGVKRAPFYVLIGASMPSILVETAFITNSNDRKKLEDNKYLDMIAEGIFKGIIKYIEETKVSYKTEK